MTCTKAVPNVISVWGLASSQFMLLEERSLIISAVILLLGRSMIPRDEVTVIRCAMTVV
ncbi:hypothetical protein AZE42_13937 [Rhizopogon vesiculosus]|uniref:Uncharacterized protein n=1 Tax=Rhizopogon vesiculosus TaxID=180088 RepID=A0A1J8QXB1_9AGAM|nr:hypothetical protein AZE42_13937 [Rhizopogon vesiculosus]